MEKTHVLKFVIKGKTFDPNVGIKTYPKQTYGVSQDAPQQFKNQNTLIGQNSYVYKHEKHPEFIYPSQRKYFNVHHCAQEGNYQTLNSQLLTNSIAFHRKKGRLSQFMDKNGWMSPVIPIMGFERNLDARNLCNIERERRIKSQMQRKVYQNPVLKKPKINPQYLSTIEGIMSQKQRIRKKRNQLKPQVKLVKMITKDGQKKEVEIQFQRQNISKQMLKSNMDFYSTTSSFYNKQEHRQNNSPEKNFRSTSTSFKKTSRQPRLSHLKNSLVSGRESSDDYKQDLQDWHRRNYKKDKWAYNLNRQDTEQRQLNTLYA